MNTQRPESPPALPPLTDQRVDEIEDALFADISREREARRRQSARRGRVWMAGGAAAAVVAVAAIIAPSIVPMVSGGAGENSAVAPADQPEGADSGITLDAPVAPQDELRSADGGGTAQESAPADATTSDRDIITTASASITVDDVETAARAISDSAVARGGYVESVTIDRDDGAALVDPTTGAEYDVMPYPYPPQGSSVTVRVPADELSAMVDELSEFGEVTSSAINRQDVTEQTVDLEARIQAAQTSVDRLTALMAQAQNVADLIAAESALAERQALLESYQQQLEMLQGQIEMSTLTVSIAPRIEQVTADPAGFGDGLAAGWNGLIAALNGIVIALGFLIPWLAVAAVVALIMWAIVRSVRALRRRRADAAAPSTSRTEDRQQ